MKNVKKKYKTCTNSGKIVNSTKNDSTTESELKMTKITLRKSR